MTAREEDILTSENLIKKGVAIDKLLDSLIMTKGVKADDLIMGDKNAVMVAARILAYGPEYECSIIHPATNETETHTFNLADCPFKKLPKGIKENNFQFKLPVSKTTITFKILTSAEEKQLDKDIQASKRVGLQVDSSLTMRYMHSITSVDGDDSREVITSLAQNMLARDSLAFRKEVAKVNPTILLEQEIDSGGDVVKVDIPMTTEFFWPAAGR
jgi:DNA-directed RNA polymerase subunit F